MIWIKKNYDRFILALFAAGLAACALMLFINTRSFNSVFAPLSEVPPAKNVVKPIDMTALAEDRNKLAEPFVWKVRTIKDTQLPTFVSVPYIEKAEADGKGGFTYKLVNPYEGDMVHEPIPNRWLIDNKQEMLATNVLNQDTDGDGFTTLDEFLGKTDPNDKDSHPPYWTKLYLSRFVRVPFRLLFEARNGTTILLNTVDIEDAPTQFLHAGDLVKGTKFKVLKLDIKQGKENGIMKDLSEATLQNLETGETIVLPKEKEVDSPTTYAELAYVWNGGDLGSRAIIKVNKNQEFTIKPDTNVKYKVLALSDLEATVLKEDENKTLKITPQPRK